MRRCGRLAWIGGALVTAVAVAGVTFAVLVGGDAGTNESAVVASGSSSPSSRATTTGSASTIEPTLTSKETDTATTPGPSATPCSERCASSGIEGQVTQSPTCPVETDPPKPECAPRPYQATIVVWNADHSAQVMTFTADENGRFRVPLEPGDYEIEPQGEGRFPLPPSPFVVTVSPDQFVHLDIEYDTGIR